MYCRYNPNESGFRERGSLPCVYLVDGAYAFYSEGREIMGPIVHLVDSAETSQEDS